MEEQLQQLQRIIEKRQSELEKLENVVGIGIGEKQRAGQSPGRLCIRVYVSQRVPEDDLPQDQIIPKEIDGYETDVEEMEPPVAL